MAVNSFSKTTAKNNFAKYNNLATYGTPVNVEYSVVAGGGSGGMILFTNNATTASRTGSGGGGGFRQGNLNIPKNFQIFVRVGAALNPSNFYTVQSAGGGSGGQIRVQGTTFTNPGVAGGSGGGGSYNSATGANTAGGTGNTPSTSPSQGNNGGASSGTEEGGGGGAGGAGGNNTAGAGSVSTITGLTYAAGGPTNYVYNKNAPFPSAAANTGNGGANGAGGGPLGPGHGIGGSGVVVIKHPDTITLNISSGLVSSTSTSGGFKTTTFTAGLGLINFT